MKEAVWLGILIGLVLGLASIIMFPTKTTPNTHLKLEFGRKP